MSNDPQPRQVNSRSSISSRCAWERDYTVHFLESLFHADELILELFANRRVLLVCPPEVWSLYGPRFHDLGLRLGLDARSFHTLAEESDKTMDQVTRICGSCAEHGMGRRDVIVGVGGGVCLDVVTVAASLVRRGIDYVCIPTTLVGQIDAGIGIKGGVNFGGRKSYLGSFYPPQAVLIDPVFLPSSPDWSLKDGMAESVKMALIRDVRLFELIERHGPKMLRDRFEAAPAQVFELIERSVASMLTELEPNFFEDQTYYRFVDFGHTFSPAIEEASRYGTTHGQAVALDMLLSSSIAMLLDRLTQREFSRIVGVVRSLGLPTSSDLLTVPLCETALEGAALHRGGTPNLVIPTGIGSCEFIDDRSMLSAPLLGAAIDRLRLA